MRTLKYYDIDPNHVVEYDPTPEDQVEAIVDFWINEYFPGMKLSDGIIEGLRALANDARYEMDYDEVIEEYCESKAREAYYCA